MATPGSNVVGALRQSITGAWRHQVQESGLVALVGDALMRMRRAALDMPDQAWLESAADRIGLNLDSRTGIEAVTELWMLQGAPDAWVCAHVLPQMRATHPTSLGSIDDASLLTLWRDCDAPLTEFLTRRIPRPRSATDLPEKSLLPKQARAILAAHYGEPVIAALEDSNRLHLVLGAEELPDEVKDGHYSQLDKIVGVTTGDNRIYLVTGRTTAATISGLFLHEVGEHAGLNQMLGKDYGRLCGQFRKLLGEGDTYATWAALRVPASTPPANVQSEQLAYLVERVANDQYAQPGGERGHTLGRECLSKLKTWLFRTPTCRWLDEIGALNALQLDPSDIACLAREAVNHFAQSLAPDASITSTNEWVSAMDPATLDRLYTADNQSRRSTLDTMQPRERAGFLYSLAALSAPGTASLIDHYGSMLAEMSLGAYGQALRSVAGEVLSMAQTQDTGERINGQILRIGMGAWFEPAPDQSVSLFTATPASGKRNGWNIQTFREGPGLIGEEFVGTLGEALKVVSPRSVPINDLDIPAVLARWQHQQHPEPQTRSEAFKRWFKESQALDDDGAPAILFHGTGASIEAFKGDVIWASTDPELANAYASNSKYTMRDATPNVLPVFVSARAPFNADLFPGGGTTIAAFFKEAYRQAAEAGRQVDYSQIEALLLSLRSCARREESGPHYSVHDFWNSPAITFGRDGAQLIKSMFAALGFDSIRYTERESLTWGVFDPRNIKSAVGNIGLFSSDRPELRFGFAGKLSRTAPATALVEARVMEAAGAEAEAIRRETGWSRGIDGLWRYEIDDSGARLYGFNPETQEPEVTSTNTDYYLDWIEEAKGRENGVPLAQILHHPALYAAYPSLARLRVRVMDLPIFNDGSFHPGDRGIENSWIALPDPYSRKLSTPTFSALMHEVQHAIQTIEGFESGSASNDERLPTSRELLVRVNQRYSLRKSQIESSAEYQSHIRQQLDGLPASERYVLGRSGQMVDRGRSKAEAAAYEKFIAPIEAERIAAIDSLLALKGPFSDLDGRYLAYLLIAGEAEARNVTTRLDMSAAERRHTPPEATLEVPVDFLLTWRGLELTASRELASVQRGTTPFENWFDGSKVTAEDGAPLVVYHGTHTWDRGDRQLGDVYAFDRLASVNIVGRAASIDTVGSWFSTNPGKGGAEKYGPTIYPVYLSIKNPHETTFRLMLRRARLLANGVDDGRRIGEPEVNAYRAWLQEMGKDGIKIVHDLSDLSTEFEHQDAWIALEAGQVKSAIGNRGTFNAANPDIRYSFAGEGAAGAPIESLAKAILQADQGKPANEIFEATGWFQGPEGRWRFEIDDSGASLLPDASYRSNSTDEEFAIYQTIGNLGTTVQKLNTVAAAALGYTAREVRGVLEHPALFEAYPALAHLRVEIKESDGFPFANDSYYQPYRNKIVVNVNPALGGNALSALLHEVQHAVQFIEHFARGGQPEMFSDLDPALERQYRQILQLDELAAAHNVSPTYFAENSDYRPSFVELVREWESAGQWGQMVGYAKEGLVPPLQRYRRLAGEVEARNVQARQAMSAQERTATPPSITQDTPDDAIIVLRSNGEHSQFKIKSGPRFSLLNPVDTADPTHLPAFDKWMQGSRAVAADGAPITVFRGQHGADIPGAVFESRLGSLSFGTLQAAHLYALEPNNRDDFVVYPRIIPAYLSIRQPLIEQHGDPFIDFAVLTSALGEEKSLQIAKDMADYVTDTQAWADLCTEETVEEHLVRHPEDLKRLYVPIYPILDDPKYVGWLKSAGFDGAIYGGSGATALETEYRVFSPAQVLAGKPLDARSLGDTRGKITADQHQQIEAAFIGAPVPPSYCPRLSSRMSPSVSGSPDLYAYPIAHNPSPTAPRAPSLC